MNLKQLAPFLSKILIAFMLTVSPFFSPLIPISPNAACAAEVTLAWDANIETNLAGYKLYYEKEIDLETFKGTDANEGDSPIIISLEDLSNPDSPLYALTGLEGGQFYYFALTAFNTEGIESDFSDIMGAIVEDDIYSLSKTKSLTGDSSNTDSSSMGGGCFISSTMNNNASGFPMPTSIMILLIEVTVLALKFHLKRDL